MYRLIIFSCLWHLSLSNQNITEFQTQKLQFSNHNESVSLRRLLRSSSRPRGEKPVDCHKLHGTDDSAFIAIILNKLSGRLLCMGSILDERHILTANPCVLNVDVKNLRVLLGYFKAWWGRHSYVFYVEKVLKHEHELVILRVTRNIQFSRTIRPIKLLRLEDGEPDPPPKTRKFDGDQLPGNNETMSSNIPTTTSAMETSPVGNDNSITNTSKSGGIVPPETERNKTNQQEQTSVTPRHDGKRKGQNHTGGQNDKHKHDEGVTEKPKNGDSEGEDVDSSRPPGGKKIYRHKKRKKIEKRQTKLMTFMEKHPKIKTILLVGFPLSRFDVQGEPISQTIIYSMKEEEVTKGNDCVEIYHMKPLPLDDETNKFARDFCSPGTSKLCWGCLGGPTLYKKDNEYIQVGVVGGANCDDEKKPTPYLHIRVDLHMNWILANSLIPPKL